MPILREIEYVGLQDSVKIILFKILEKVHQNSRSIFQFGENYLKRPLKQAIDHQYKPDLAWQMYFIDRLSNCLTK